MEHGLKDIAFYVQKHTTPCTVVITSLAGSRQAARVARICERSLLDPCIWKCFGKMVAILSQPQCVNSPPPSAAYMRQWIGSALAQIMACRLFVAEPLSETMLTYCQLEHKEHISIKFCFKFKYFPARRCIWIWCLRMAAILSSGRWVKYRQVSNIRRTLIGNEIVDNSDVVGASPVGAAPTTSSLST